MQVIDSHYIQAKGGFTFSTIPRGIQIPYTCRLKLC